MYFIFNEIKKKCNNTICYITLHIMENVLQSFFLIQLKNIITNYFCSQQYVEFRSITMSSSSMI